MESDGEPYQTLPLNNLNQYYEDCSTFRKELTIFGSLVYHVNLIFDRIKAALRKSQVKYRLSRLIGRDLINLSETESVMYISG